LPSVVRRAIDPLVVVVVEVLVVFKEAVVGDVLDVEFRQW
jgi:hypothetical protein